MNWKLLAQVIASQVVEFSVFWLIAGWIPLALPHSTKFLILLAADVAFTEIVFPGAFGYLIQMILKKDE